MTDKVPHGRPQAILHRFARPTTPTPIKIGVACAGAGALALLWAALVFSRQLVWRWRYLPIVLFPVVWSYVAVYQLENFLLAAGPAVLFLSGATFWTGLVFWRHQRLVGGAGVAVLAVIGLQGRSEEMEIVVGLGLRLAGDLGRHVGEHV